MANNHGNPFEHYITGIENQIAKSGVEGLSERELLTLQIGYSRRMIQRLSSPFWANWRPRDVATAAVIVLTALGVTSSGAASMALKLLGT